MIGHKFLLFNNIYQNAIGIKEQVFPALKKLCDDTSETIDMVILDGIEPVGIALVVPKQVLRVLPRINNKYPLHCTSAGKIFLVYMPSERIENFFNTLGLTAYTDNTITDKARLKEEIEIVRRDGTAFDDEEYFIGVRSAAAPIKGENGRVLAAVSLVGPSARISRLKMKWG